MLTSDLPADDPFLKLVGLFFAELAFIGRTCQGQANEQGRTDLILRYCARREIPLRALVATLERECGLRLADARLPYRHNSATWPQGHPMAGYTDEAPTPSPSQWLASVFSNWKTIAGSESTDMAEVGGVLRSALWVCHDSGVAAALRYVVDLVVAGHVLDVRAAAWAASRIAIGSSLASDPEEVVSRLVDGGTPTDGPGWLFLVPSSECWRAPGRPSPVAAGALESLIVHGWALVEQARMAATLDNWLPAVIALNGTLRFIRDVVKLTLGEVPTEVAAILSQFEELYCDAGVALSLLEISENGGEGAGIAGLIAYERDLQRRFQNAGDRSGLRFRQERLLLPVSVMESEGSGGWTRPSWRIGVPWVMCSVMGDPREFVPELGTAYQHFERKETGQARVLLDDVLDSYPYNDAAHWLRAKTYESDGDHRAALDSVLPVLLLRPEHHEGWELLGHALDALGHRHSAALALRMYAFSLRRGADRDTSATEDPTMQEASSSRRPRPE